MFIRSLYLIAICAVLAACGANTKPVFLNSDEQLTQHFGSIESYANERQAALEGNYSARRIGIIDNDPNLGHSNWIRGATPDEPFVHYMNVGIETKTVKSVMYYRIELYPLKVEQRVIDQWPPYINIRLKKKNDRRFMTYVLPAQLPEDRSLDTNGYLTTEWTLCIPCVGLSPSGKRYTGDFQKKQQKFFAHLRTAKAHVPEFKHVKFLNKPAYPVISGEAAVAKATLLGNILTANDRALANRNKRLAPARKEYKNFVKNYHKSSPVGRLEQQCGAFGPTTADYGLRLRRVIELIDHRKEKIEKFIDCSDTFTSTYDFVAREESLDSIISRENFLAEAAETPEKKRTKISIDTESSHTQKFISKQLSDYEIFRKKVAKVLAFEVSVEKNNAAWRQYGQQQRQKLLTNPLGDWQRNNEKMMRQNREFMARIDRMKQQAIEEKTQRAKAAHKRASTTVRTTPNVSYTPPTATTVKTKPKSTNSSNTSSNTNTRPAPKQTVAENKPTTTSPKELKKLSGGMFGCVGVVDTKRVPGSSPHSSCSYKTPDREALLITFVNRCSVPINVNLSLAFDDGSNQTSGEYGISPGVKRQTVGHCGATNYTYSYEETSASYSKRNK